MALERPTTFEDYHVPTDMPPPIALEAFAEATGFGLATGYVKCPS